MICKDSGDSRRVIVGGLNGSQAGKMEAYFAPKPRRGLPSGPGECGHKDRHRIFIGNRA